MGKYKSSNANPAKVNQKFKLLIKCILSNGAYCNKVYWIQDQVAVISLIYSEKNKIFKVSGYFFKQSWVSFSRSAQLLTGQFASQIKFIEQTHFGSFTSFELSSPPKIELPIAHTMGLSNSVAPTYGLSNSVALTGPPLRYQRRSHL